LEFFSLRGGDYPETACSYTVFGAQSVADDASEILVGDVKDVSDGYLPVMENFVKKSNVQ
jgi:hypothetical protein